MEFQPRTYRRSVDPKGLVTFEVVVRETDLAISALTDLREEATALVTALRADIEGFASRHPRFLTSFVPYDVPDDVPGIVAEMARAAALAGVGPMAAVAGAMAEHVARGLAEYSAEVVVENGGDCFLLGTTERIAAIHAGPSPLSGRVGIVIAPESLPLAVCTSSASVGPSISLGRADAAVVLAVGGALADAAASALGNRVHSERDVERAMEAVRGIEGVVGLAVVVGETLGAWGAARLVPLA
jgi:ApbE superfamily uncharacterized protein (UPF0280 family)